MYTTTLHLRFAPISTLAATLIEGTHVFSVSASLLLNSVVSCFVSRFASASARMPKGKKPRKYAHSAVTQLPRAVFLGHSMPRNLSRYLNTLSVQRGRNDESFRNLSLQQKYVKLLGIDSLYKDLFFVHCATVKSDLFLQKVTEVQRLNADIIFINISSNDLAQKEAVEGNIATTLSERIQPLVNMGQVKRIVFLSELKRCDIPNSKGKGRLECSVDEFRRRVMAYNSIIQAECERNNKLIYNWLFGFWWDADKREIEVAEWSTDRLHPGPHFHSEGFQKYYWSVRRIMFKRFHDIF